MLLLGWNASTSRSLDSVNACVDVSIACNKCKFEFASKTKSFEIFNKNGNTLDLQKFREQVLKQISAGFRCNRCNYDRKLDEKGIETLKQELQNRISERWRRKAVQKYFRGFPKIPRMYA